MTISSIGWPRDSWVQNNWTTGNWNATTTTTINYLITWNVSTTTTSYVIPPIPTNWTPPVIKQRDAEEIALEQAAEQASEELVRQLVGKAGYESWKKLGYIEIESKTLPGTVYRVKRDAIDLYKREGGNIIDLKQWLCVHPRRLDSGIYPSGDEVATRILLARFAEDELWEKANLHDKNRQVTLTRQDQLARYQRLLLATAV